MDSGRIFFDPSSSCHGNMLFLGNGDNVFRGTRSMLNAEETSKRRPFFNSVSEEMYDEEYYDEQLPEKKRRLSPEQVHMLEKSFEEENKLEPDRKTQLAKKLGLQPRQVAVWFQNRRARWKTKTLERDYDRLKSMYDSLGSDYDSIVKENEKLKTEVLSLSEKLQPKEEEKVEFSGKLSDSQPVEAAGDNPDLELKIEDQISIGSGGSAVVDDQDGPQLMDSGDSYFPNDDYPEYVGPIDHSEEDEYVGPIDHSEEDDGSDDGRSYFSDVFAPAEQQYHREEEAMGWWVWQ